MQDFFILQDLHIKEHPLHYSSFIVWLICTYFAEHASLKCGPAPSHRQRNALCQPAVIICPRWRGYSSVNSLSPVTGKNEMEPKTCPMLRIKSTLRVQRKNYSLKSDWQGGQTHITIGVACPWCRVWTKCMYHMSTVFVYEFSLSKQWD